MAKYGNLLRAVVLSSSPSTGKIEVAIPTIAGDQARMEISKVNRKPIDGVWKVPAVGDVILVAADDDHLSTLFVVPTYTYETNSRATNFFGDFAGPVVFTARNDSGASIAANTVVCGQADGSELVITKANGNDTAKPAIGITVDNIAADAYGKVAVGGVLSPIDTSSFAANIDLFAGTTGNLVSTPVGLANPQIVCRVLEVGAAGSVLLTVENPATEELGSFSGTFLGTIYATAGNLGGSASGWIIDSNRIESRGSTQKIVLDGTDGEIYIGTYGVGVYNSASTPFYVNEDGYFSLGNKLTFDPTTSTLDVNGTVTADDGQIGGWTIEANKLSAGTGASTVALASSGGTAIWAGASAPAGATFKVTDSGYLTASGVDLSGRLVATSGSIGNWLIDGGTLKSTTGSAGTPIVLDSTSGKVYVGNENWANTANRFYVDNTGKFSLGSKLTWDTTNLIVDGTITAASGTIGGWSIDTAKLYAGSASTYIALSSDNTSEYRTWAGHPTAASAPYYVTKYGGLYASNASIQGNLTASAGTIGGFTLGANTLTAGTGSSAVGIASDSTYPFWAGKTDRYTAPFSVRYDGYVTASSVSVLNFYNTGASPAIINGQFTVDGGKVQLGRQIGTGASNTGIYINKTVGTTNDSAWDNYIYADGTARIGNATSSMVFDGTDLTVTGKINAASINAQVGNVGGFTLGATSLTAGTGSSAVGLNTTGYPFYAGSTTASAANFRVTSTGTLTATGASLVGDVSANAFKYTTAGSTSVFIGSFTTPTYIGGVSNGAPTTTTADRGIQVYPNRTGWNPAGVSTVIDTFNVGENAQETLFFGAIPSSGASISYPYLGTYYNGGVVSTQFTNVTFDTGTFVSPWNSAHTSKAALDMATYIETGSGNDDHYSTISMYTTKRNSSNFIRATATFEAQPQLASLVASEYNTITAVTNESRLENYYNVLQWLYNGSSKFSVNTNGRIDATRIILASNTDVNLTDAMSVGYGMQIGDGTGTNMVFDTDEIFVRSGEGVSATAGYMRIGLPTSSSVGVAENGTILTGKFQTDIQDIGNRYFVRTNTAHANAQQMERGNTSATTNASGDISVTFTEAFSSAPSIIAVPYDTGGTDRTIVVTARSTSGFTVRSRTGGTADASATRAFMWIAMGPR